MDEASEADLTHETLIHDLNNVFETITEVAELLSREKYWKTLAATLSRSVERGKRLLGAIPDRTPNLKTILDDAIQSVADYCLASRRPRMRFVHQIPADLHLPGSAKDWERVFVNLFLNAAQMTERPGRIDIAAQKSAESLLITVSDTGPGIPAEILPRIFRPNVSTKPGRSERTGLGLHIVASIVEKYQGRVEAANKERGSGAVFSIFLPSS